jgi:RNA polymerase sigma factor (sigma-70 family)
VVHPEPPADEPTLQPDPVSQPSATARPAAEPANPFAQLSFDELPDDAVQLFCRAEDAARIAGIWCAVQEKVHDLGRWYSEDARQEALLALLLNRSCLECRTRAGLLAWLRRVLWNAERLALRSELRRRRRETAVAACEGAVPGADVLMEHAECLERIALVVEGLAEPYRAVIVLRHFKGLPVASIAEVLGRPVGTIKWRLHRARALLRPRLRALGIGPDYL